MPGGGRDMPKPFSDFDWETTMRYQLHEETKQGSNDEAGRIRGRNEPNCIPACPWAEAPNSPKTEVVDRP